MRQLSPEPVDIVIRPDHDWLRTDGIRGLVGFEPSVDVREGPGYDAERYAQAYKRMGMRSAIVVAKHHQGIMAYPSTLNPNKPRRDFFGEQLEALHRNGLRGLAYYSVGPDNWAGSNHPDWLVTTRDGRRFSTPYWTFLWLCLNTGYADYALGQIREIVEAYPVDGIWLDILRYPQAAGGIADEVCFCSGCMSAFVGDHNLLDVAGTRELLQFHGETQARFLRRVREAIGVRPGVALTFNGAGKWMGPGYEECDLLADFGSMECHNPVRRTTWGRLYRSAGRPFELLSCAQLRWGYTQDKPLTLLQLELACTMVHGGVTVFGVHMYTDGLLSEAKVKHLETLAEWFDAHRDLVVGTDPVYEIALIAERTPLGVSTSADGFSSRSGYELYPEWARTLRQGQFLFGIVPDVDRIGNVRLVVLAAGASVTMDAAASLRRFVESGGTLVVEGPLGRSHGDGRAELEALLGIAAETTCPEPFHYLSVAVDDLRKDLMDEPLLLRHPVTLVSLREATPIASLMHQFTKGKPSEGSGGPYEEIRDDVAHWGGMTVHALGRGRAVFVSSPLVAPNPYYPPGVWSSGVWPYQRSVFEPPPPGPAPVSAFEPIDPWPRALVRNLLNWLLRPSAIKVDAPPEVEVVCNRQQDRYVLHLINHAYGPSEHIDHRGEVRRLGRTAVTLHEGRLGRIASARCVPGGEELAMRREGDSVTFDVTGLGVHQAIELRTS